MDAFSEELAREGDVLRVREEELRGGQGKMDDEHEDVSGYVYDSNACYDCHPTGSE